MRLHVTWMEVPGLWEGGHWGLAKANGDWFVGAFQYGKHPLTKKQLEEVARLWNEAQDAKADQRAA
jgi:hypothetical protein